MTVVCPYCHHTTEGEQFEEEEMCSNCGSVFKMEHDCCWDYETETGDCYDYAVEAGHAAEPGA